MAGCVTNYVKCNENYYLKKICLTPLVVTSPSPSLRTYGAHVFLENAEKTNFFERDVFMPLGQRQLWVVGLFFDPDHINLEEVSFKYFRYNLDSRMN